MGLNNADELPAAVEEQLLWRQKVNGDLVRIAVPTTRIRQEKELSPDWSMLPASLLRMLDDRAPREHRTPTTTRATSVHYPPDPSSYWERSLRAQMPYAEFGSILHSAGVLTRKHKRRLQAPSSETSIEESDNIFLAQTPYVRDLLSTLTVKYQDISNDFEPQNKLYATLIPSPGAKHGFDAMRAYPRVEICFTIANIPDGSRKLILSEVTALYAEFVADVCLPQLATDFRMIRRSTFPAITERIEQDPEVRRFVEAVQRSANSEDRLRAPNMLKLKIPSWAMNETNHAGLEAERNQYKDVAVNYMFLGFEQRESRDFIAPNSSRSRFYLDVRDANRPFLRLTNIDAGKVRGNRAVLALLPENIGLPSVDRTLSFIFATARAIQRVNENPPRIAPKSGRARTEQSPTLLEAGSSAG